MKASELIITEAPHAPTARNAPRPTGPFSIDDARPGPNRGGHSRATVRAARAWLSHVLAESARGWALAAGVNPDLYD